MIRKWTRWRTVRDVEQLPTEGGRTQFEGVTLADVRADGTGLYELTTRDGVPVRLHDMSYLDLTYRPGPAALLTLRFRYDDPASTPEAAAATPVAVLSFSKVVVVQHEDEEAPLGTPTSAFGQVVDFSYGPGDGTFILQTFNTYLIFRAERFALSLESDIIG